MWGGSKELDVLVLKEPEGRVPLSLPAAARRASFSPILDQLNPALPDRPGGQSMVEFAFTLVIILILLVGLVDLGRAIFTYLALRDAAQEGASFASYNPNDTAGITSRVCNSSNMVSDLCANPGLDTQVTLIGNACNGNGIQVQVTFDNFTLVTPFLGALIGTQTITISASVTDSILAPPCT